MNARTLITGATDGIGLALARTYARDGRSLLLVGRKPLAALHDPLFTDDTYCEADLSQDDCVKRINAACQSRDVAAFDLIVHNAGTGYWGSIAAQPEDDIRTLLDVNLRAPIAVTHQLVDRLRKGRGRVVFIGSVVVAISSPDYAVYGASKAALDGLARSLSYEVEPEVGVQAIHPGATHTGLHAKIGLTRERVDWTRFPSADEVAGQIARAIEGEPRRRVLGGVNRAIWALGRGASCLFDALTPTSEKAMAPVANDGQRHAVVTGAADGIGRALCHVHAGQGYRITGVDVDADRSASCQASIRSAGGVAEFIIADLGDVASLSNVIDELIDGPPIDILIHNAGISVVGRFPDVPIDDQLRVLDVNLVAPLLLTPRLLQAGKVSTDGTIVFLCSLSHFVGYPGASAYAASKDGIASYARSLRSALKPSGVRVLTVFPGPTRTEHARRYSLDNARESERMLPEDLADQIVKAVQKNRRILVPGVRNRLAACAGKWVPIAVERAMARAMLGQR